jgi:hypothetical protein
MSTNNMGVTMGFSTKKVIALGSFGLWAALLSASCAFAADALTLSGAQEVPPTTSAATGTSSITVAADKTVTGSVMVTGLAATAAHIHQAKKGVNGGVIVPLVKSGDNTFNVPAGTKLTDPQYAAFQAGELYVNVHTKANPGGEIRAQLGPAK